jgi:hypothetical protein
LIVSGIINYVFRNGGMLKEQDIYATLLEATYIKSICHIKEKKVKWPYADSAGANLYSGGSQV